jgi:hypothetical protein
MKSENAIGLWWGFISWIIMFSALLYWAPESKPPTPIPAVSAYNHQDQSPDKTKVQGPRQNSDAALYSSLDKISLAIDAHRESEERNHREDHAPKKWWRRIDPNWFIVTLTAALVFLGWRQWLTYKHQARVMAETLEETRNANKAAEKAIHLSERAEMQIAEFKLTSVSRFTAGAQIEIVSRNLGRTIAKEFYVSMKAFDAQDSHAASTKDIVPAGGQSIAPFPLNQFPNVSSERLEHWSSGEEAFRIIVELNFIDVFDKRGHVIYDATWSRSLSAFNYTVTKYERQQT